MKITPLEIRQHEFEKTFRGYNIEEVDSFLANLSQEWERVLNESKMLRMQLEIAEKEANKLREIEMTLFKTLKTAEDTSTMITEQASQQADKHVQEAKILGEKTLIDAQHKAAEIIRQAESKAKYIKEEVLGDVKVLERDFRAMDHYKTNLLVQMRSLSNATLEHVQRFEEKFDKEGVDAKFKEATSMLTTDTNEPEIVEKPIETLTSTTPLEAFETEISNTESDDIEVYDDNIDTEEIVAENTADETLLDEINEIAVESNEPIIEELEIETPLAEEQEFPLEEEVIASAANNFEEISEIEVESEPIKSNVPKTDELDIIEGIGPKISMLLYDAGIFTFRDLAITPVYKIEEILESAGPQYARHDPSTWTQQAKLAAEGRWDDLEALKTFLIRGKEPEKVEEVVEEEETPTIESHVEEVVTEIEDTAPEIASELAAEENVIEVTTPLDAVVQAPVENNLDSITEEMLEKVNKVKAAIRKAMVEKSDSTVKDNSPLPTVNDVIGKPNESSGGSFFDNI